MAFQWRRKRRKEIENLNAKPTKSKLIIGKMSNPLLQKFDTPFETVPFRQLQAEHFESAFKQKIKEAKNALESVISNSETPSFSNTITPIEIKYDEVSRLGLILFNLDSACTNKKIQEVTKKISPILTRYMSKLLMNKKYFKRVEYIYLNQEPHLNEEEQRLLEITYLSMKRNGANLAYRKKIRLMHIQIQLSKLTLLYNDHVLAETNSYTYHTTNINDLKGLPDNDIEAAANLAKSKAKDGWLFTLQFPSYGPFMKYIDNRDLREQMYKEYNSRCNKNNQYDNKKLIRKIVTLRHKQAKLLGYKNYAAYTLVERMAKTPENVSSFLQKIHHASHHSALKEIEELKTFAKTCGHVGELMPWDFSYYSEKLKEKKFAFDENEVKPYFELEKVIYGVFGLANTLYGLTFKKVNTIEIYHDDVSTYEVHDQDGAFLAILYTDFHPRENKQSGAWMTEYRSQSNINGNMIRPHISICCNFTKAIESKPSLLTFSEVNTFLHEFGHALHGMLANTIYPSLSGTNVYRDFVELPSQIMENWATETEWLQQFATHYETGEPITVDLIHKLINARNFQAGYLSERQLSFGILDMTWHELSTSFKQDVVAFEREQITKTNHLPNVDGCSISTSFSHIFSGGYAAGYYGYKWAEVLDADAFSVFKKEGIFNKEVANKFRTTILEKGGTQHPMQEYLKFKGSEPDPDALLKRSGLI